MATLTLSPEAMLQPRFLEGIINKKMEAQLSFNDLFPVVRTDALSFTYFEDTTTAGADITAGTQSKPAPLMELGELTEIETSTISMSHGAMERYGYSFRFSQRQMREPSFIDEISRAVDRAVYGMSSKMNDDIISAWQTAGGTTNTTFQSAFTPVAVWSGSTAEPITDILSMVEASQNQGYPYEMTDLYLEKANYFELLKILTQTDINYVINPLGGMPSIPQIAGVNIHNLSTQSSELTHSYFLGADKRYPGITIYEHLDPGFSTMENGHVMINKYVEERYPYNIVVEMFAERGVAAKLPYALYYDSGI